MPRTLCHKRTTLICVLPLLLITSAALAVGLDARAIAPREFAPVQEGYTLSGDVSLPYAPGRIRVQFTPAAMRAGRLNVDLAKGTVVPGAVTGLRSVDEICAAFGVRSIWRPVIQLKDTRQAERLGVPRRFMIELDAKADVIGLAKRLEADPNVESAVPDWRAYPAAIPNDPYQADNWGHNNTVQLPGLDWGGTYDHTLSTTVGTPGFDANARAAWDGSQGYGSSVVVIAIVDSGVDTDHDDLRLVAGYDYGDNDSNPDDNSAQPGHGTCCAGVAAARANNSMEVVGIAGGCSVMPLKVANSAGSMYFSSIENAIYHAADNGADVISMSLGAAISSDSATDAAIQYAYNAGCVILAATGNENMSTISYPAINAYVIGVGAASPCGERKRSSSSSSECNPGVSTDPNGYTCDGERWWGSNYGSATRDAAGAVDILAPTILPTTDIEGSGGYRSGDVEPFFNGTSCATPYAAGVCALVKSKNPTWTPAQIRAQICDTAQDVTSVESGTGWDRYSGYGMIDAAAAVGGGGPVELPPVAAFSGTPTSGYLPLAVSFTDASSNTPTSWYWTFGDGGTSSAQNPGHTYTSAGSYTVTLTATNAYGSDGETKTNYITVMDPGSLYADLPYATGFETGSLDGHWTTASTTTGRVLVATGNTPHTGSYHLTMDCSSNGTYAQNEGWLHLDLGGLAQVDLDFWWKEFGDETHTQDGVYFSSNGGSSFTKVQALNGASYTNNTWQHFTLDVDALCASYGLSLSSTFVVKFQQYDNYMITTDGFAFDDISVTGTGAGDPPVAAFSGTPTSGDYPLVVQFTDASTNVPTGWNWTFGDGATSTARNPSHTYTAAGTYTVTLTATNAWGSDPETKAGYITVTTPAGGVWETITYDDFESGWGSYTDGGGDCARYTGGTYAHQGSAAADIQDNSGVASSFYHTGSYNVSGYVGMEVEFWFYAYSMDNNEDFWLQYYDGSAWRTIATWAQPANFSNNVFYNKVVTIPTSYAYPTNAKLRFMCDASGNSDDVYIDEIEWRGLTAGKAGSGLDLAGKTAPAVFSLAQNYPNPFNPTTTLSYSLEKDGNARLEIFDVAGRRVAVLVDGPETAGPHFVTWNAARQASGVYFARFTADRRMATTRMVLVR